MTRCEHRSKCVCRAFTQQVFREGAADRRVVAEVEGATQAYVDGGIGLGAKPAAVRVEWARANVSRDGEESRRESSLTACFQGQASKLQFEVHATLDESGHVTAASVAKGPVTDTQRACVVRVAKTFAYVCPARAGDVLEVRYLVHVP